MSAGVRAKMAASSVATHRKQPSSSTQTSVTPVIAQKEKGTHKTTDAVPTQQQDASTSTLSPASPTDPAANRPHTVSHEYHIPTTITPITNDEFESPTETKTNAHTKNKTSISDSDSLDLPNEAQQVILQESEQHDYEYAPTIEAPLEPSAGMHDEHGVLLSSLGPSSGLLAPVRKELEGRKCLILDLDETLVHSSFRYIRRADFVIPVQIDSQFHNVYVIKRPGVDEFMRRVGELYEVVVFTASVSKYGDPLLDQLDIHNVVHHRLFRESCYNHQGNFVKNLAVLGRPLKDVIIIDNSPTSYIFHPQHAIPVSSWFSDAHDNELLDMIPFLEDLATSKVPDVSMVLDVNLE